MTNSKTRTKVEAILLHTGEKATLSELRDLFHDLEYRDGDWADFQGGEYRLIDDLCIWDIYVDEIKEVVEDCYNLDIPEWVEIDWERTARNTYVDGYGHHFSSYDGEETLHKSVWVFRTN